MMVRTNCWQRRDHAPRRTAGRRTRRRAASNDTDRQTTRKIDHSSAFVLWSCWETPQCVGSSQHQKSYGTRQQPQSTSTCQSHVTLLGGDTTTTNNKQQTTNEQHNTTRFVVRCSLFVGLLLGHGCPHYNRMKSALSNDCTIEGIRHLCRHRAPAEQSLVHHSASLTVC